MDGSDVEVTVRPIEEADFEEVFNLSGKNISKDEIISSAQDGKASLCFVAEVNGKVVGFNLAHLLPVGIPLNKICVIQGIVVHDSYRRLGIGEKLIDAVFDQCEDCGIGMIRALVEESDLRLKQFIEHEGFDRSTVINYDRPIYYRRSLKNSYFR